MADKTEATPAKRTRKAGPRNPAPVFAIVSFTNANGEVVDLNAGTLSFTLERDPMKIVKYVTGGGATSGTAVVQAQLPAPKPKAEEAPAAA